MFCPEQGWGWSWPCLGYTPLHPMTIAGRGQREGSRLGGVGWGGGCAGQSWAVSLREEGNQELQGIHPSKGRPRVEEADCL